MRIGKRAHTVDTLRQLASTAAAAQLINASHDPPHALAVFNATLTSNLMRDPRHDVADGGCTRLPPGHALSGRHRGISLALGPVSMETVTSFGPGRLGRT